VLLLWSGSAAFAQQLSGTYTINSAQPTGGTNFASFAAAAMALNTQGISGPVRINVLNGPYSEQFALNTVVGVSPTDTIVVDGGAAKQTLNHLGTTAQMAAVLLNGTSYVTLQNLTIDASPLAVGVGVHFVGAASNNRVRDCVVRGGSGTATTNSAGIAASGTQTSVITAGAGSNLRIENNLIESGYYGVISTGASVAVRNSGIRVTGNEIRNFHGYGVDVENSNGPRVIGNDIHRTNRTTGATFYGVYVAGCIGTAVERNRIHDPFTANLTSTLIAYGIFFSNADATAGN
jgi:hypothetical protein